MNVIRSRELKEGRWRNGMGVSWDIASDPPDTADFGWRLAIARIDADVPFSHYPEVDRVFTLIEGNGLDLDFDGGETLAVHRLFVPHPYACDRPTFCRLKQGPCRALNLFTRRGRWQASVEILSSGAEISHPGTVITHVLDGSARVNGEAMQRGDTLIDRDHVKIEGGGLIYVAKLSATPVSG